MPKKLRDLQEMAEDSRRLAAAANKDAIREQLLEIADQFDRMVAERRKSLEKIKARY